MARESDMLPLSAVATPRVVDPGMAAIVCVQDFVRRGSCPNQHYTNTQSQRATTSMITTCSFPSRFSNYCLTMPWLCRAEMASAVHSPHRRRGLLGSRRLLRRSNCLPGTSTDWQMASKRGISEESIMPMGDIFSQDTESSGFPVGLSWYVIPFKMLPMT